MPNVKISVIIPVYNVENCLKRCLDSIVNQTLKDIEIICVNDGSVDSSLEILKGYAQNDSRIRIINQKNSGSGAARNLGVKIAQGEYLGFVDADDWIESNYFETLYNAAKKIDADISRTMLKRHYNNDYTFGQEFRLAKELDLKEEKVQIISKDISVFTKIFKRQFIIDNNIKFGKKRGQDIPFSFFATFYAKKIANTDNTCYNYLMRKNSIMRRKNTKWDIAILDEYKNIINFLRAKHITYYDKALVQKLKEEQYNIYPRLSIIDKKFFLKKLTKLFPEADIVVDRKESSLFRFLIHQIFSIKNSCDRKHKIITILGIKIKIRKSQRSN